MMKIDEMIAVLQAAKEGKKIQIQDLKGNGIWYDDGTPLWNFTVCNYRVKPKPREWWFNEYPSGPGPVYSCKAQALMNCTCGSKTTKVREVLDDEQ